MIRTPNPNNLPRQISPIAEHNFHSPDCIHTIKSSKTVKIGRANAWS